ncbi:helix-turn-helix transcriptional regulator [Spirillospora sp. CA-294931]|uniref:helix-turn-helix transcriptional regulator n=1 Tax=Spirillospora sp. CA-294931 TaxID=3240042 RepID=UPI003D8B5AC8
MATTARAGAERRTELAAFLRSRRERITPEDVGLPPGPRRRTPGLRREEVAQLAGVGVTWYTWLEQGRPINASGQVLDAVARTLMLDPVEREHLYLLAEVPVAAAESTDRLAPDLQEILDGLDPLPAAVVSHRSDLLAWNRTFAAIFPGVAYAPPAERNLTWLIFTLPPCCNPIADMAKEAPVHVATLRYRYSRHLNEPGWKDLVRRVNEASPEFARLWAKRDVAQPTAQRKVFRHPAVGEMSTRLTIMELASPRHSRVIVYTPTDQRARDRIARLLADPVLARADHEH